MKRISRILSLTFFALAILAGCTGGQTGLEPTATAGEAATSTTKAALDEETARTGCDLPLPGSDEWEVVVCEQFDDNSHGWETETQDNPYASYTSAIEDGKFTVDYTAKGFAGYQRTALTWFTIGVGKDFILSLEGLMDSAFEEVSWGIAFRGNGEDFFLFSILNNGKYIFEIFEDGNWIPLISAKTYNGIKPGETNAVRIEAGGQDFYFSINGTMVNQFNGALLEGEEILLIVSVKEGAQADFAFDNVVLQK
jgi:hypothetical protein